jgi:hypothetical protein
MTSDLLYFILIVPNIMQSTLSKRNDNLNKQRLYYEVYIKH